MKKEYRMPAEWEPQRAIQLTWPHADTDWKPRLADITHTFVELTRLISHYEQVLIAATDANSVEKLLRSCLTEAEYAQVKVVECSSNDTWTRDHGPITLLSAEGTPRLLNFCFNGWGEKFPASEDNALNSRMKQMGVYADTMEDHTDFVLEGGSIESDGKGTVFTTAECLLAPHRNQPLSQQDLTRELQRRLHAERIIWLHHGHLLGDDTDGHIDTLVRLADPDTLIFQGCKDEQDPHFSSLQQLKEELLQLRTSDGEPYRLIELPMPHAIYDEEGNRLPATYANFLILNGAVICPTYADNQSDTRALQLMAAAFPGRDILPLDAQTIVWQHGSVHCLTMQRY